MDSSHNRLIASEGWPLLVVLAAAAGICRYLGWHAGLWLLLPLLGLTMVYFRNPRRVVPAAPLGVVSPVDGRIVAIGGDHDPFLDRLCQRVTIDMHWYGVFTLRNPMEGKIQNQWFERPAGAPAWLRQNAIFCQWVQSDEHDDVVVCMEPYRWRRQRVFYAQPGERTGQGQRCGFMHLGARVHILLPARVTLQCQSGQRVRAGMDMLARLVH